jgi:hypothetical protein
VTRVIVEVDRDPDGRLHGTVGSDAPGADVVHFTGVIELIATIEASLVQVSPVVDHPDPDRTA